MKNCSGTISRIVLGLGVILTFGRPALAAWQYTSWGMSPDEVADASSGTAMISPGDPGDRIKGYDIGAIGNYQSGKHTFTANFYFENGHLALVGLRLVSGDALKCNKLIADLTAAYGKPFSESERPSLLAIYTWHDQNRQNFVGYTKIGEATCSVQYKPLINEDNSGL